jgi:hypothetical protein
MNEGTPLISDSALPNTIVLTRTLKGQNCSTLGWLCVFFIKGKIESAVSWRRGVSSRLTRHAYRYSTKKGAGVPSNYYNSPMLSGGDSSKIVSNYQLLKRKLDLMRTIKQLEKRFLLH